MTRFALALLIFTVPAWGQSTPNDPDLEKALAICDQHGRREMPVYHAHAPWYQGWEDCQKVRDELSRIKESAPKKTVDQEWLEQYVKGLK